jgi:hypothetical protein
MSETALATTATPSPTSRSHGRGYFWLGIGVCLLGVALFFVQLALKQLFTPWYAAVLATLGAILMVVSVARRFSIARVVGLVLVAALAGFEWFFLVSLTRLPEYHGPARAGSQFPAFSATFADGRQFTDADLRDRSRRAMVFFRGRW